LLLPVRDVLAEAIRRYRHRPVWSEKGADVPEAGPELGQGLSPMDLVIAFEILKEFFEGPPLLCRPHEGSNAQLGGPYLAQALIERPDGRLAVRRPTGFPVLASLVVVR